MTRLYFIFKLEVFNGVETNCGIAHSLALGI